MKPLKVAVNVIEDWIVAAFAVDLLYLYYDGAWGEPITWIRISELVILWALIPFGVWRIIVHLREV